MFSIENRSLERSTIDLIEREPTREEKRRVEGVGKKRGTEVEEARWEKGKWRGTETTILGV